MNRHQEIKSFAESDRCLSGGKAEEQAEVTRSVCVGWVRGGRSGRPGFVPGSGQRSEGGRNIEVPSLGSMEQSGLQSRTRSALAGCRFMEG